MFGAFLVILVVLASLAIPIIIVVAIVNAIRKNKDDKKEESFQSIVRTIYLYIMLVIFLCMMIGSSLGVVDSLLDIFLPKEDFGKNISSLNEKNQLITNAFSYLAALIISVPMFIYHSRKIKSNKNVEADKNVDA